jgi:hypothetical protein
MLNAKWHDAHPMPPKATMDQRIAWHLAHRAACGCRPIPGGVVAAMAAHGEATTTGARPAKKR